MEEWRYSSMSS